MKRIDERKVGVFYYAKGKVYADAVSTKDGESYGDFVTHADHFSYYDELLAMYPRVFNPRLDYDYFPRGRVVFNKNLNKYVLYMDRKINKPEILELLMDEFDLSPGSFVVDTTDEHYVSRAIA